MKLLQSSDIDTLLRKLIFGYARGKVIVVQDYICENIEKAYAENNKIFDIILAMDNISTKDKMDFIAKVFSFFPDKRLSEMNIMHILFTKFKYIDDTIDYQLLRRSDPLDTDRMKRIASLYPNRFFLFALKNCLSMLKVMEKLYGKEIY